MATKYAWVKDDYVVVDDDGVVCLSDTCPCNGVNPDWDACFPCGNCVTLIFIIERAFSTNMRVSFELPRFTDQVMYKNRGFSGDVMYDNAVSTPIPSATCSGSFTVLDGVVIIGPCTLIIGGDTFLFGPYIHYGPFAESSCDSWGVTTTDAWGTYYTATPQVLEMPFSDGLESDALCTAYFWFGETTTNAYSGSTYFADYYEIYLDGNLITNVTTDNSTWTHIDLTPPFSISASVAYTVNPLTNRFEYRLYVLNTAFKWKTSTCGGPVGEYGGGYEVRERV